MSDYRVLYGSTTTGDIQGELPIIQLSYTKTLNAPGSCSVTVPLRPAAPLSAQDVLPWRTSVYVERDGVIVWGGIVVTHRGSVSDNTFQLDAVGFWSYFRSRLLTTSVTYSATDQDAIARDLIEWAQGQAGGDIGITTTANLHGVTRDRSYFWHEFKNIGQLVEQLAAVDNGFDFYIDSTWSSGSILNSLVTVYPALGRSDSNLVFEIGSNVELLDFSSDGTALVNAAYALGQSTGDEQPVAMATNLGLIGAGYPLLETVVTDRDVNVTATLEDKAARAITRGQRPMERLAINVLGDLPPGYGSWMVGDRAQVRGSHGLLDIASTYRIVEETVAVSTNSDEDIRLSLVSQEVFG